MRERERGGDGICMKVSLLQNNFMLNVCLKKKAMYNLVYVYNKYTIHTHTARVVIFY